MGTCNFKAVEGVSVGMVAEDISAEEIELEKQEMVSEGFDEPTEEQAVERLLLNESETISEALAQAQMFAEKLQKWIIIVKPPVLEENDIEDVLKVVVEQGYYSGFQLYVEFDKTYLTEKLAQVGEHNAHVVDQVEKVYKTAQFLLVDYTFNNGLGITFGGYRGGVAYEGISDSWKSYYLKADVGLVANFKEYMKEL